MFPEVRSCDNHGRETTSEDVANAVAFLVSDVSVHIVGQILYVDGGPTMQ